MKLIRSLVFPWLVLFFAISATLIVLGVKYPLIVVKSEPLRFGLLTGSVLCLMANVRSLGSVGIWMLESLPESLRYGSWRWIFRAIKAALVASMFWFTGQLSWTPLIWQVAVLPVVLTIALFVAVFSLVGPILKFSSNMAWNRAFSVVLSLPIFVTVPLTAQFVGQSIVTAYRASQPDLAIIAEQAETAARAAPVLALKSDGKNIGGTAAKTMVKDAKSPSGKGASAALPLDGQIVAIDKRAIALKALVDSRQPCVDSDKEILTALDPRAADDIAYWGARAVECSDLRSVVALPRLVQVMTEHQNSKVRATSIRAMKKFGNQNVQQIAYLLLKRLSDKEPPEVVEAAAQALAPLGGNEHRFASIRLKGLLDSKNSSTVSAQVLLRDYQREDLVEEYVGQHLTGGDEARQRAVGMICALTPTKRQIAEPHVREIVGLIRSGDLADPGVSALNCLGPAGFKAIRDEVNRPNRLERSVAARVLAEMNAKDEPEALETSDACARDPNEQVRLWCSRSLGQIGSPALPKILALLQSNDASLKDAGRNALQYFTDPRAKEELRKVKLENSGWMANAKKLQIAKAAGTALMKIEQSNRSQ